MVTSPNCLKSVVTLTNLFDPQNLEEVENGIDTILEDLNAYRGSDTYIPPDIEICVCKAVVEDEQVIAYYFASMAEQSVFWFEDVDEDTITEFERIAVSDTHLGE